LKEMSDIKPIPCPHCDFSRGTRGGDCCAKCGGTGSVFRAGSKIYPNTREGYDEAIAATQSEVGDEL